MRKYYTMSRFSIFTLSVGILVILTTISLCRCHDENSIERKIIVSENAPIPLAFYSQAVQVGNTMYISGNLGMTKDGILVEGVVNQTILALKNMEHILKAAGVTFNHDFKEKAPARSAYSAKLPRDALVEIEAIAVVGNIVDIQEKNRGLELLPIFVLVHSLSIVIALSQ